MLQFNHLYYENLKKRLDEIPYTPAGYIERMRLQQQIEEIEGIKEEFIYPEDYKKVNPFLPDIEKKILSGEQFFFILSGKVSRGKTYLMKIIKDNVSRLYIKPFFRYSPLWYDIPKEWRNYLRKDTIGEFTPKPFCFFDDLGAETPRTEASKEFIQRLVYSIHENYMTGKIQGCVISTNYTYKDILKNYGDRTAERLIEFAEVLKFENESFRIKKIKKDL